MIYLPTLRQIHNAIKKIYDSIKIDLLKDTSPQGIEINLAITNYYNATNPQASDLINLKEKIYSYQNSLPATVTYFKAVDKLLITVQNIVNKNIIGYTQISQNFAKDDLIISGNKPSLTSALSNYTIAPKENVYLNSCTRDGELFQVGGSIFSSFDRFARGIKLSEMNGIDTIFGRIAAIAQCGTAKTSISYQDFYITTSSKGGTIGNYEETGCTAVIDPATLGGYCNSVFASMND